MKDLKSMSLADIKAQIAELQKKADELVKAEKATLIEEMKENIANYGITAGELGFGSSTRSTVKSTSSKPKAAVMYKNGELTWSGGRGPKPKWVKEILDE